MFGMSPVDISGKKSDNLNLEVTWPLSEIIDEEAMGIYNRVRTFLLQIKRSKFSLDVLGNDSIRSSFVHSLHLLKAKFLHFVNNLQNYIITRVLQSLWLDFQTSVESANDLSEIISLHRKYLSTIRDRCLLNPKFHLILNTILRILNLSLRFRECYAEANETSLPLARQKKLQNDCEKIRVEFDQCNALLLTIITKIVSQKKLPHCKFLQLVKLIASGRSCLTSHRLLRLINSAGVNLKSLISCKQINFDPSCPSLSRSL